MEKSWAMEAEFVLDEIVGERRERDAERYSQIVSFWSKADDALSFFLERLRDDSSLDSHLRDDIRTFQVMMNILIPFLGCMSKWLDFGWKYNRNSKDSLHSVRRVLENVIQEFEALGIESLCISEAEDPNSYATATAGIVVSNLIELRNMKPKMRELHSFVSMSDEPLRQPPTGEATEVLRFVNLLLDHLNAMLCFEDDFIVFLKEQIEDLQKQLMFFRNFLGFLSEICNQPNFSAKLFYCAETRAVDAGCLLYFILVDKMEGEDTARKIRTELLDVVEKIKPFSRWDLQSIYVPSPRLDHWRNIYLEALEASRKIIRGPFVIGEYALGFFDSLIHKLREVLDKRAYFETAPEEPIESLLENLSSVRCYIEETPSANYQEGSENLKSGLRDLIIDLGCFIYSKRGLEAQEKLVNLLDKIQFIESASGDLLIPNSWQYNFPKTNELGFINFILLNLGERLNFNMISPDLWNCSIDTVYEELVALRHDFGEIAGISEENGELRSLLTHYKDVAYQAEYLFDLSFSASEFSAYLRLGLTSLRERIRQISEAVKAITMKMTSDNLVHYLADCPGVSIEANPASNVAVKRPTDETGSHTNKATDQLVGLEVEIEMIKGQLMRGSQQLKVLSIVGMPGIGKTTLANSVYGDPAVTLHFHARAWCSVSQVFQKKNLLNEILHQVRRETDQDLRKNDKDLDQQVYQNLKGRRYLVILDDIWEAKVWADLRLCFPNDGNGSRVLFTTRNHDVAIQANSVPHALQLLSDEESWKLLRIKVFKEETCPVELLQVGKKIAEDCKGLPLAVVLIGGVLNTAERKQNCWIRVQKELRTYVVDASGQQLGTMELSYVHLPDYLKPCFLYFGAFPEDTEIPVCKLLRLWVAEGFIQQKKGDQISLECEAENYLNALIERSLVIIAKRSSRGGIKACQIHDLLRDFCLIRAKEERFLLQTNRCETFPNFRISEMHEQYRLCIATHSNPSVRMVHFESRVRTLFVSRLSSGYMYSYSFPEPTADVPLHFSPEFFPGARYCDYLRGSAFLDKFRLLRVLDLGNVRIEDEKDFITIFRLVYLRYLAIRASHIREIPAEVANLKDLETFLLEATSWVNVSLEAIWSMANLRHLHIDGGFMSCFKLLIDSPKFFEGLWPLESLTTFSTPELRCDKRIEKMIRNLPNLQKLKCTFIDSCDPLKSCNHFPALDLLDRLESLNVCCLGRELNPCNLTFPLSIKKLTLRQSRLSWNAISIIGRLPNLEVLKLLLGAFTGPEWNMDDREFQKLKFLKLVSLDIVAWSASSEHLPHLELLVLEDCRDLEEVPSILGEIPTLRRIVMKRCSPSAVHSVKQIETEQIEMGNDQFKAFISS